MQWEKPQTRIYKTLYTKKTIEEKLQLDNAYLNENYYHYLIASLGLIPLKSKGFKDLLGSEIHRKKINSNLEYESGFNLEKLSLASAIQDSTSIMLILAKDIEEEFITVTYNTDLKIRAYIGEEEIPPLLLGYELLITLINNLKISGYVNLNGNLTKLGLVFIKGVLGQTKNLEELRKIFNGDKTED